MAARSAAGVGGYVLAVLTHMLWNGSLVGAEAMGPGLFLLVTVVLFVAFFVTVAIAAVRGDQG